MKIFFVIGITLVLNACTDSDPDKCLTPEFVGAIEPSGYSENAIEIAIIKTELDKTDENIDDFYIELIARETGYTAYLWHKSTFFIENCSAVGNPGGLSRTYIIENEQVTEQLGWL